MSDNLSGPARIQQAFVKAPKTAPVVWWFLWDQTCYGSNFWAQHTVPEGHRGWTELRQRIDAQAAFNNGQFSSGMRDGWNTIGYHGCLRGIFTVSKISLHYCAAWNTLYRMIDGTSAPDTRARKGVPGVIYDNKTILFGPLTVLVWREDAKQWYEDALKRCIKGERLSMRDPLVLTDRWMENVPNTPGLREIYERHVNVT